MFDVGFTELLLLSVVGLLVLGPERLPRVARTLGGLARRARSSWLSLKRSIEAEMRAEELRELLDPEVLADVELELQCVTEGRRARSADELHDAYVQSLKDWGLSAERLELCYELAPPRVKRHLSAEIEHVVSLIPRDAVVLELGCG